MVKLLVCGDVRGRLGQLYAAAERLRAESGPFACVLCIGEYFPLQHEAGALIEGVDVADYVSGKLKAPLPTYFLGGRDPNGRKWLDAAGGSGKLAADIALLGAATGVQSLHGLRVAFASDVGADEEAAAIEALTGEAAAPGFAGVDVLLTNSWPTSIADDEHLDDTAPPPSPPPAAGAAEGCAVAPAPAASRATSTLASCAAAALRPRYHFAAGSAQAWSRAAYENVSVPHVSRFIALAPSTTEGDDLSAVSLHPLDIGPLDSLASSELWAQPADVTPCPYRGAAMRESFPPAVRAFPKYGPLLEELFPAAKKRPQPQAQPRKQERRAVVAHVGYSDSESSEDEEEDEDGSDSESGDSSDDSDDSDAESSRAAKRRKADTAPPAKPATTTKPAVAAGAGVLGLGSAEDLFASTGRSAELVQKGEAFEVPGWDRREQEAKAREQMQSAAQTVAVDFIVRPILRFVQVSMHKLGRREDRS